MSIFIMGQASAAQTGTESDKKCVEAPVCAPPKAGEDYTKACQLPLITQEKALKSELATRIKNTAQSIIDDGEKNCKNESKVGKKFADTRYARCVSSTTHYQGVSALMSQIDFDNLDVPDVYKIWVTTFFLEKKITEDFFAHKINDIDYRKEVIYLHILDDTITGLDVRNFYPCDEKNPTPRGFLYKPWAERHPDL